VIWAVAGRKGSSGATTLAALLARVWPQTEGARFVIEADPDGGALAARWHAALGTTHEPGLLTLAAVRDGSPGQRLARHAQAVAAGVELVAGPPGAAQAEASLRALGEAAPAAFAKSASHCFVDCGRLHARSAALPWASRARRVLFVARPRLDEVVALRPVVESLMPLELPLGLVCVGDRPFHPVEVTEQAGLPLVGVIADDPVTARSVSMAGLEGRWLRRSRLARTVAELAANLAAAVPAELEEPALTGADT
jgi:hypothetical protein